MSNILPALPLHSECIHISYDVVQNDVSYNVILKWHSHHFMRKRFVRQLVYIFYCRGWICAVSREFSIAVNVPLVNVVERMSCPQRRVYCALCLHSLIDVQSKTCLMSSPQHEGLLRMRSVLNVRSACSLPKSWTQNRPISRCSRIGGAVGGGWWMRGRSCHVSLFCSLISTISGSASFTSITKKQGTLVMAITHSFHDLRVDINDRWLN